MAKEKNSGLSKNFYMGKGVVTRRDMNGNITEITQELFFHKYLGIERGEQVVTSPIVPSQLESLGITLKYAAQDPTAKVFVIGDVSEHKSPADGYMKINEGNTFGGFNPVYLSKKEVAIYANNPQKLLAFRIQTLIDGKTSHPQNVK